MRNLGKPVIGGGHGVGQNRDRGWVILGGDRDDALLRYRLAFGESAIELDTHTAHTEAHIYTAHLAHPASPAVVDVIKRYRLARLHGLHAGTHL